MARSFSLNNFTFEDLTETAVNTFQGRSLDQIRELIEGMEASESALFDKTDTADKSMISISNLIMRRLIKYEAPAPPEMKLFYGGFYAVYLAEWMKFFQLNDTLHLIDNEMLVKRPFDTLLGLEKFLGLAPILEHFPLIFEQNLNTGYYCVNNTVRAEVFKFYDKNFKPETDWPYKPLLWRFPRTGLECLGVDKSRTRTKEKTPSELASLGRLAAMYAESNRQLTHLIKNQEYAAWTHN